MTDYISRADAISIVHSAIEAKIPFAIVADLIKGLPSADAEDRLYIKIYADDEPSVKAEKLYQICDETQNREVAKWLKEYFLSAEAEPKWNCTANFVAEQLERLMDMTDEERLKLLQTMFSSADAEQGEWVRHELWGNPWFTCSECNYHGRNDFNFCPNCGARMKGGDE